MSAPSSSQPRQHPPRPKADQQRAVDVGRMITHAFKFEDVFQSLELHRIQDEGAVKIVVDMEG